MPPAENATATVTGKTTKLLTGVAIAALAAVAVTAVVNSRLGREPDSNDRAHLDELEARLDGADPPHGTPPGLVGRILDRLHRDQGISVHRLRGWITGLRRGTLSPEQANVAESDFDALERQAHQGGA